MQIRVVSLNVWIGGTLFDRIVDFLLEQNADIVLLQEVFNAQNHKLPTHLNTFTKLIEHLKYPYGEFAPAFKEHIEGQYVDQGNAVLSRYPLQAQVTTFFDEPYQVRDNTRQAFHLTPRNLQHVVAELPQTQLHLFNTQGIWGEDGGDSPRRTAMAEHILREVGDNTPTVLAGDFNLQPSTQAVKRIEGSLTNVFKDELNTTFNTARKDLKAYPGFATAVVDMVFVTHDLTVVHHDCPKVDISDHLPLVVDLKLP